MELLVAEIEPVSGDDRNHTLSRHFASKAYTPEDVTGEPVCTYSGVPLHSSDTSLHRFCEICVKWDRLPVVVRAALENRNSLPDYIRNAIEALVCSAAAGMLCIRTHTVLHATVYPYVRRCYVIVAP